MRLISFSSLSSLYPTGQVAFPKALDNGPSEGKREKGKGKRQGSL
jgi:hypothetical protein